MSSSVALSGARWKRDATMRGRFALLGLAALAAVQAAWLLAAELVRPNALIDSVSAEQRLSMSEYRVRSLRAAIIGVVRGDLWGQYALSFGTELLRGASEGRDAESAEVPGRARAAALRALRYAPHDARVWLLLASIDARLDFLNYKTAAALRMSYYTGLSELALAPQRLLVAIRSEAIGDTELQPLLRRDIRIIVTKRPDSESIIRLAYQNALPDGRRLIEDTLREIGPSALAIVNPTVPR